MIYLLKYKKYIRKFFNCLSNINTKYNIIFIVECLNCSLMRSVISIYHLFYHLFIQIYILSINIKRSNIFYQSMAFISNTKKTESKQYQILSVVFYCVVMDYYDHTHHLSHQLIQFVVFYQKQQQWHKQHKRNNKKHHCETKQLCLVYCLK